MFSFFTFEYYHFKVILLSFLLRFEKRGSVSLFLAFVNILAKANVTTLIFIIILGF